jgi:hypothetical protein
MSAEPEQEKIVRLVYIGPSLRQGLLKTGTVFKGGYPEELNQLMDKVPALRDLFVSPAKLGAARASLAQPGGRYQTVFERVRQWVAEEARERNRPKPVQPMQP